MGQVGLSARDGIDRMMETGRGVVQVLEAGEQTPARVDALAQMKQAHKALKEARAAVERIR